MRPRTFSSLIVTLSLAVATVICARAGLAKGPKPPPTPVNRPISFQVVSNADIRLADEAGSSLITVNANVSHGGWPRWSPDGTLIGGYFNLLSDSSGRIVERQIMGMRPDGSGEFIVITSTTFNAWNLNRPGILSSFLPNITNQHIFHNPACWLDNGAMVFGSYSEYAPSFFGETDGSYYSNGMRLFVVDADGGIWPLSETAIQNAGGDGAYDDFDPHWSAVLNKIVFVSDRSGSKELYAINPDGTGLQQITDVGGVQHFGGPVWNPAGDRIAVTVRPILNSASDLWILDVDLTQQNPGTGAGGRVTAIDLIKAEGNGVYEESAAWSPMEDRIVFARYWWGGSGRQKNGTFQIVIADVAFGAESIVTQSSSTAAAMRPDWNPVP